MFHLQSLELLHWDYCQRVTLPLDGAIITIAGPNGSGKTTLLDAMRTLLGLECSGGRTYKTATLSSLQCPFGGPCLTAEPSPDFAKGAVARPGEWHRAKVTVVASASGRTGSLAVDDVEVHSGKFADDTTPDVVIIVLGALYGRETSEIVYDDIVIRRQGP